MTKPAAEITKIGKVSLEGADCVVLDGFDVNRNTPFVSNHAIAMAMLDAFYAEAKRRIDLMPLEIPRYCEVELKL